ncbi:MAG TPA: hypothetical protein EYP22_02100 [Methanosarcinales archaeon]|nr:hypothetical protein [Methanosarcinales archaeon]
MDATVKAVKEGVIDIDIAGDAETTYISSGLRSTIAQGIPFYRKIEKLDCDKICIKEKNIRKNKI